MPVAGYILRVKFPVLLLGLGPGLYFLYCLGMLNEKTLCKEKVQNFY